MLIVFEGIDGSGKSTQIRLLAEYLKRDRDLDVLVLQEPGGTRLGQSIRSILLDPSTGHLDPTTEVFLFMAARSHLVAERIGPALSSGAVVLCDRFLWSSVVYQGIVGGLGIAPVMRMGRLACAEVEPARTLILDLPVAAACRRKKGLSPSDRMELKGRRFQEKVRKGFLELAKLYPRKAAVIDARGSPQEVHEHVLENLPRFRR